MHTHHYSSDDRAEHLRRLEHALAALVRALVPYPAFAHPRETYRAALAEVQRLRTTGYEQSDLSAVARSVPALFWVHKEWMPPLVLDANGRWTPPPWFTELEPLERRAVAAADRLRVVGWY